MLCQLKLEGANTVQCTMHLLCIMRRCCWFIPWAATAFAMSDLMAVLLCQKVQQKVACACAACDFNQNMSMVHQVLLACAFWLSFGSA